MLIGVPKESLRHEHRVALTPFGVSRLRALGCEVLVEHGAGDDSHFHDRDFSGAGAATVYGPEEIFGRSDLVSKVGTVSLQEAEMARPGATLCGFMHAPLMPRATLQALAERQVTVVGWEAVEEPDGSHPVRRAMSELAGEMAIHWAAHLLQYENGGRGIVLGGVPGIAPATVVILGAGIVGVSAARAALALRAHVILMDVDLRKLRRALEQGCEHAVTALASPRNLARYVPIADALVGAVATPAGRAPFLVTEAMVRTMKPGSVVLDLAIDQGGCVETSRPTSLDAPTFRVHGVTHFCVPNVPANVPRTASRALTLAALPFLERLAQLGLSGALRAAPGLARGVSLYRGRPVHDLPARTLGVEAARLEDLLEE